MQKELAGFAHVLAGAVHVALGTTWKLLTVFDIYTSDSGVGSRDSGGIQGCGVQNPALHFCR